MTKDFLLCMTQINSEIYLIFADARANSNKYWSGKANNDGTLEISWGRVGYSGQTKVYNCSSYTKAISKLQTLAAAKKQKGYRESQTQFHSLEQLQIRRALQLLEKIKVHVQHLRFNDWGYLEALNEYLTIVPTPLEMSINPATIYPNVAAVDRQVHLLQQLNSPTASTDQSDSLSNAQASLPPISLKSISNLFWKF